MAKGSNSMLMVISMMDSLLMDLQKGMENIYGKINLCIRGISSKAIAMVMEYGKRKKVLSDIQAIICWIRNMAMGSMNGQLVMFIKEHICKIKGKERGNYIRMDNSNIEVCGKMEIILSKKHLTFNYFLLLNSRRNP